MKAIHQTYSPLTVAKEKTGWLTRFRNWTVAQDNNRIIWMAIGVAGHGCVFTPLTLLFIMFGGNQMFFWAIAIAAMGMTLVSNLAALPTKVTIPIFLFSLLLDLFVIVNCIVLAATV